MIMNQKLNPGLIRVVFNAKTPFTITQIGNFFILIEKIYSQFSKQIFENTDFCLLINTISNELSAFDLVASTNDYKPIKFSDFEELTMCVLYSIYSSSLEKELDFIDEHSKSTYDSVLEIVNIVKPDQQIIITSAIDNKYVKITISSGCKVNLEKADTLQQIQVFKNIKDVMQAYEKNKLESFINCNLEEFDISGVILSGANFVDSDLYKVNFNDSILQGTNFFNADVSEANLTRATLTHSTLEEADFSGANLSNADLSFSNLSNADFSGANLTDAILYNTTICGTDFSGANLTNVQFTGDVEFMTDTDFSNNANWWDAKIENDKLKQWLEKYYPRKN